MTDRVLSTTVDSFHEWLSIVFIFCISCGSYCIVLVIMQFVPMGCGQLRCNSKRKILHIVVDKYIYLPTYPIITVKYEC